MAEVYGFRRNQPVVWFHDQLALSNRACLYCGTYLVDGVEASDKEHLISRAFGHAESFKTGQEFNFIFRACVRCNREKSDIERHLSSVTLFNSPARSTNAVVNRSALHKAAHDFHPVERKKVSESHSTLELASNGPGISMKFGLIAPPQPVRSHVIGLAFRHIQGLFTLVTATNPRESEGMRILTPGHFRFFGYFAHGDWGNAQLLEISRRVRDWPCLAPIDTAGGFFRAVLRRQEGERGEWFWALEWNQSLRVFGAITDRALPTAYENLPDLPWKQWDKEHRYRQDRPLQPGEDILFS